MSDYMVDRKAEDGEDFTSSNIDILGYDAESETLYVEFHSSPTVYSYSGVKESTYDMLVNADSVGSFYARHIKGTYDGEIEGEGVIELREVEDTSPQGDVKWLTGDESPFALTDTFLSSVTVQPAKFGVKYTMTYESPDGSQGSGPQGPFEPVFEALSEGDALAQFAEAQKQMENLTGWTINSKIVSVTHYFE